MGGEVTIADALERIDSGTTKERTEALADLKHILRHSQQNSRVNVLSDAALHRIYERLFQVVINDQSANLKAKTPTLRTAAVNRLASCANALRLAVEAGLRIIKLKTVRAVLDHVIQTLRLSNGSFCEPVALDYAKCMRIMLSYQPHAEHLHRKEWEQATEFCLENIKSVQADIADDDASSEAEDSSARSASKFVSYRSTRSHLNASNSLGSQGSRSLSKQVAEEMIRSLRCLTAAPNAPVMAKATDIIWVIIKYLQSNMSTGQSHQDAFGAINNVLAWTTTENIDLTKKITSHLLRLARHLWSSKSTAIRDEILIMLTFLRLYIRHLMDHEAATALKTELGPLLEVMQVEYNKRLERDQLHLDDLRLRVALTDKPQEGCIERTVFALRSTGARAEHSWAAISFQALLCEVLDQKDKEEDSSGEVDEEDGNPRPRKRQRTTSPLDELIFATANGLPAERKSACQVLAFLAQQSPLSPKQLARILDGLTVSCSDDNGAVSSWAFFAVSSCASQKSSDDSVLTTRWSTIWQMACRSMSNATVCRTACHFLKIALQVRLVAQSAMVDLHQTLTTSIDLNGPSVIADSTLQLLEMSLHTLLTMNPAKTAKASESIIGWLARHWLPSRFDDRTYAMQHASFDVADLVNLIMVCLNHQDCKMPIMTFPTWDRVGRCTLRCETNDGLVSYLLLLPKAQDFAHTYLRHTHLTNKSVSSASLSRHTAEALLLGHFDAEITKTWDVLSQMVHERPRAISLDMFATLCCASLASLVVAHTSQAFKDDRRLAQFKEVTRRLLNILEEFAGTTDCDQDKMDVLLKYCSQGFTLLSTNKKVDNAALKPWEPVLGSALSKAYNAKRQAVEFGGLAEDHDMMETDDSQYTQRSGAEDTVTKETGPDFWAGTYGLVALRATVPLYATAVTTRERIMNDTQSQPFEASSKLIDHILSLPDGTVIASRRILARLPFFGIELSAADAHQLLSHLVEGIIQPVYEFQRSEVAIGTTLEVMSSLRRLWTDPQAEMLSNLGLDFYDWCTSTALEAGVLSPSVQKRVAALLLKLCQTNPEYGAESDVPSVRTSLFQMLKLGTITVQFYLGERISAIFGLFVLGTHDAMFDDLQQSLPASHECTEGISMRLFILAKLASAWPSLLRQCIYYIFEAAGRMSEFTTYAATCVKDVSETLRFDSPQKLFALFASQLIFTWFDGTHRLQRLPFSAFGFQSLEELLLHTKTEVVAQIQIRGLDDEMKFVSNLLKKDIKDLVKDAFGKCLAYAIGEDIEFPPKDTSKLTRESRLRNVIGPKDEFKSLITLHFPMVMGQFYVSTRMEDPDDKWLEKREKYGDAAKAMTDMRSFSYSNRVLTTLQQPSFKTRYLPDQIERLCRRIGQDTDTSVWNASALTLAIRMLLDSIDIALGPLHTCTVIRKLRILISMAGETALSGYPFEMLLRSLQPFLSDSQCADDTLGIMRYLLHNGRNYLVENVDLLASTVTVTILRFQKHIAARHDSMTQETQHRETVQRMQNFWTWLIKLLQQFRSSMPGALPEGFQDLTEALSQIRLPGNARKGSPESALLLLLLRQSQGSGKLLREQDTWHAISMLVEKFELPSNPSEDCLATDSDSARYAPSLWRAIQHPGLDEDFVLWCAGAVGRAYASTGSRDGFEDMSASRELNARIDESDEIARSVAAIANRISRLTLSGKQGEASVAEYTLRSIMHDLDAIDGAEAVEFEKLLPPHVVKALCGGTFGYVPAAVRLLPAAVDRQALRQVLRKTTSQSVTEWAAETAALVCQWQQTRPYILALPILLSAVKDLAAVLLPWVLHVTLYDDMNRDPALQSELSDALNMHFALEDEAVRPKQRYLLQLLLYLRSQPFPGESTQVDRLRWLGCDYLVAADCASRCGMPTVALMLAEWAGTPVPTNRRASSRASMSQVVQVSIPDDLLLSVFQQVNEPDSFYGVQQPASLDSVFGRLDYEKAGFKGLMFRSAQLDSHMQHSHQVSGTDGVGMVRSLSLLSLNSLAFALASGGASDAASAPDELLGTARKLQQWDIAVPEDHRSDNATLMRAFQDLTRSSERAGNIQVIKRLALEHLSSVTTLDRSKVPSHSWLNVMGVLSETLDVVSSSGQAELADLCRNIGSRQTWMSLAAYDDFHDLLHSRPTLFGALGQNKALLRSLGGNAKEMHILEAKALLSVSTVARKHGQLQDALTAATRLTDLSATGRSIGLKIESAARQEVASVLWEAGETTASVNLLRERMQSADLETDTIPIGRSGLLAQLGRQLAEARLEKPGDILESYLKPAIAHLREQTVGDEAGQVYHAFASFCDQQLQSPANLEDYYRLAKLRQRKEEEIKGLEAVLSQNRKAGADRELTKKALSAAHKWFKIDDEEFQKVKKSRDTFVEQSLQNYLLALTASDEHNLSALRFFALWLENAESSSANAVVNKNLPFVPSWKFVLLLNQLMSRLKEDKSSFQKALTQLAYQISSQHPYHGLHHVYASTQVPTGKARDARILAAKSIRVKLENDKEKGGFVKRFFTADANFKALAQSDEPGKGAKSKYALKDLPMSAKVARATLSLQLPPSTVSVQLRPDGDYSDVPIVTRYEPVVLIMGGLSAPKVLTATASDGKQYKQLFKSGNDDLRQDAIMEQVFGEVSKMLQNHKATRERKLQIRTYKVIPLTNSGGIIEFVPNSMPINDFLLPAHEQYYPADYKQPIARQKIASVSQHSVETRVKEYRKVCEHLHPVMRHFFFERFLDPDEWFAKRTAYTRTTATVSILGHVLGLGDRHCQNILLDQKSGEVIHIDLGVAFEAGRILPIPELVPFRLSRDIVDGMGATKTEGVFRRSCEFTMDALRQDKDSIMTLLNVLRYDPLYTWTLSPVRAKRMQDAQDGGHDVSDVEAAESSKKKESEAGEAERALAIVEKKLSSNLSTAATVNELIQQATDERNLATLFAGWTAYF